MSTVNSLACAFALLCISTPASTTAADRTPVDHVPSPDVARTTALPQVEDPASINSVWNIGDVFVGVAGGQYFHYDNAGHLVDVLSTGFSGYTTGGAFDVTGKLYTTCFSANRVVVFSATDPHTILQTIDTSIPGGTNPEDIVFAANGDFYVTNVSGNGNIQRYNAAGVFQQTYVTGRSDWMDLATDQTTMFYTTESPNIARWNVATNGALSDFANIGGTTFAFRLLPPGDGSGGLIAAHLGDIVRLNGSGNIVQAYDVVGEDSWFSLNLDPNGTSFWAGDFTSGRFYRFNIGTGAVEVGPINTNTGSQTLYGICVNGEITQALCSASVEPPSYITTAVPGNGYGLNFAVTTRQSCSGVHQLSLQVAPPYSSWLFDVEPPVVTGVGPNQTTTFTVTFLVPLGTPSGEYAFALRAIGDGAFLGYSNIDITVPSTHVIDDLGFRPRPDAYGFCNTASTPSWEMFRQLFGASNVEFSNRDHRPAAQDFFDHNYVPVGRGGSCNGFSATSMINYQHLDQPNAAAYAMPPTTSLFSTGGFSDYADPITYYQAAQTSKEVHCRRSESLHQTPANVYAQIKHALQNGSSGVIAIFHGQGANRGGHALTPYRLSEGQHGADVYVYDSNQPGDNDRRVRFDFDNDTWSYRFGDVLSPCEDIWTEILCILGVDCVWDGGANDHSIGFEPLSLYLDQGVPWWTPGSDVSGECPGVLVTIAGTGQTTIGDGLGNFIGSGSGFADGIEGSSALQPLNGWNEAQGWEAYNLPSEGTYSLNHSGTTPGEEVSVLRPGGLTSVKVPGTEVLEAGVREGGTALDFHAGGSTNCQAKVARDVGDQGRVAEWAVGSAPGVYWAVRGDSTGALLALGERGGSATYSLELQTLGPSRAQRALAGLNIQAGEEHSLALGDWGELATRDIVIEVGVNGVPSRRLIATNADLDMSPDALNAGSRGKYVTAFCQLRSPWELASFIPNSFRLGTLTPTGPATVGDENGDGAPDLTIKFDRAAVLRVIGTASTWTAELTGLCILNRDTLYVSARDTMRIIRPQVVHPSAGEVLACGTDYLLEWAVPTDLSADAVDLVFSSDNGTTWTPISGGITSGTTLIWQVPATPADSALIGVEAYCRGAFIIQGVSGYFHLIQGTTGVGVDLGKDALMLAPPRPMPFSREVMISYNLPQEEHVQMRVFDVSGRLVRTLAVGSASAGTHFVLWDGTDDGGSAISAGVYLLRLEAGGAVRTRRLVSVR